MIEFTTKWKSYSQGNKANFTPAKERRLIQINKAKPADVDHMDLLHSEGLTTPDQILEADLTQFKGIGEATEKKIKSQVKDLL